VLSLGLVSLGLVACEPATVIPPIPVRDTSWDADLDATIPIIRRDSAPFDGSESSRDTTGLDVAVPDDGGFRLDIDIDGDLVESAWDDTTIASSSAVGFGAFTDCSLAALRTTYDDSYFYLAVEGVLCNGALVVYAVAPGDGVLLTTIPLGDNIGEVDVVASRAFVHTDPDDRPRFLWGTSLVPASPSSANERLGWRELSQDGPHRHLTNDLSACSGDICETRVPRSEVGDPTSLRLAVRIATADDGSLLALPFEPEADISLSAFVAVPNR
jgi:hypothetical protein